MSLRVGGVYSYRSSLGCWQTFLILDAVRGFFRIYRLDVDDAGQPMHYVHESSMIATESTEIA